MNLDALDRTMPFDWLCATGSSKQHEESGSKKNYAAQA
jgi:hypothetical protein